MAISTTAAVIGMGAMGALGASSAASSANAQADLTSEAAQRKYRLESGVATQQMDEQQSIALLKMTDISREFIQAKSTAKVQEAEMGTSGVTSERMERVMSTKASEARGAVAQEVDTNVVNIAQGMLASKIETESTIAQANASRKNVLFDSILGGIQGGLQGYSLGNSLGGTSTNPYSASTASNKQLSGQVSTLGSFNRLQR